MKVYPSYIQHTRRMNMILPVLEKMILEKVRNYQRFEDFKLSWH